jgi:hypothetical protein
MKTLWGFSLLVIAQMPLAAVQVGDTYEQVTIEKGLPPGRMGAGGVVILAYPDQTIRLLNNHVIRISGPPRQISVVPAPKPKPKPKPVPVWITDVDEAFNQAREKNRNILLFVTGSGWGPRSQRLESDVLSTTEFVQYASDHLVLLKMDFPKVAPSGPGNADTPAKEVAAAPTPTPTSGATAVPTPSAAPASPAPTPSPSGSPAASAKLANEIKGDDYPMVFVLYSDGRPSGSLGYPEGGPGPFIEALKKM